MKTLWMAVAVGASLAGCASGGPTARKTAKTTAVATAAPAPKPAELGGDVVKIVAHRPSARRYKYVGRIQARASSGDFVDAAIAADADLRRQARALGADLVKLDVIKPPRDNARPHRRVILAGRAYKSVVE
jgi:hypothetical protein